MTKYQKKNLLIGGLLAIVVLMGIAYAAFASNLTITGTGSVSSNWCIGFDSTRTSDYQATAGKSGGTTPTGSISFSGDACSTSFKTTASLNASFKQPGDKIEYTLTIGNKGTLAAAIESITVDNQSVTSDTTITKGNIKYIIEMPESTSLAVNATTTMKVTAMFQNDTDVTSSGAEQQTISIAINAVQDDGNGGFTPTPSTQTVYSWNTDTITVGTSQLTDLVSTKTTNPYYTSEADIQSALNGKTGSTIYNKYTVENDTITEGYACQTFGILSRAECIKMSTDGSEYGYDAGGNHTGNAGILKALQSNSTFTGASGSCGFYSSTSRCGVGYLSLGAGSGGGVDANDTDTSAYCIVGDNGGASCYE